MMFSKLVRWVGVSMVAAMIPAIAVAKPATHSLTRHATGKSTTLVSKQSPKPGVTKTKKVITRANGAKKVVTKKVTHGKLASKAHKGSKLHAKKHAATKLHAKKHVASKLHAAKKKATALHAKSTIKSANMM